MEVELKIINCYVVTVDSNNTVFENGCIVVNNGKIVDIGDASIALNYESEQLIDAQGCVVIPGLVNAHNHAAMTIYRGMADDLPLQEWLHEHIFPTEAKFTTKESVRTGTQLAAIEMLKSGTTTFTDMYYFEDEVAKVCKEYGIRGVLSQAIIDFPAPDFPTSAATLQYTEDLMQKYSDDEYVTIIPGPHSPYTCQPETLKKARALANKYDSVLSIHLSETWGEYDNAIKETGNTPVKNLEEMGLLDGKTLAAHCVFVSEDDVKLMLKHNVAAVNNPQSNLKLVSGIAPVPMMKDNGIVVALGTDGVVSNNNLDMFEEMKTAALIHKMNNNNPTALNAQTMLRMATVDGARALGMQDKIGSLEAGKCADMVLININQPHLMPLYNIYSQLVYAVKGHDVDMVIVNGKIVMDNKKVVAADELQVMIDAQIIANQIIDEKMANS